MIFNLILSMISKREKNDKKNIFFKISFNINF